MKKASIGIKYCGGCRTSYDRRKALKIICELLADECSFEPVHEEKQYDAVLVMNGCPAQCADTSRLHTATGFVSCSNLVTPQDVSLKIKTMLNQNEP